jgi:hypothetical protein
MKMTKDVSIVFVVGIVGSEQSWTQGTCEMFHMILLVAGRDITTPQCHTTFCTDKIEALEVISFTKRGLLAVWAIYREELGGHDISTVQTGEAIQVIYSAQGTDKGALHRPSARKT